LALLRNEDFINGNFTTEFINTFEFSETS
jgi:hypothetical protein